MRQSISTITTLLLAMLLIQGCSKTYLNRPPLSAPTAGTFYQTDAEILAGTGPLYNAAWFNYAGTGEQEIGDVMGGQELTDDYQFRAAWANFTVNENTPALPGAYTAFWSVISNANVVAYNIQNASAGASASAKSFGLAECRFMRASAYYFLALDWGAVPIIYDNISQIGDTTIQRNNLTDVWKFIIMDLTYAAKIMPSTPPQPARITKWSAEGMLAKAYLARSGLTGSGGQRSQSDLDSAKYYALDVAANSGLSLDPSYYDLFTSKSFSGQTIPQECLFALLWVPNGGYFTQNTAQSNRAYSPLITQTGDGWGAAFGASASLLSYYMDPANKADSIRRRTTFFMPGDYYPDISQSTGGWHVDTASFNNAGITAPGATPKNHGSYDHAFIKKYVIGSPADNGGLGGTQNENCNTHMLRLSDVYLTLADAILGNNASTSDATALKYFNMVRTRAGVATKNSITYADLVQERKIEFAFEGHTFYDWKIWYYFNPTAALNYFSTQNRGNYNITYNAGHPFVTYFGSDNFTPGVVNYTITANTADIPFPEAERIVSPDLSKPPVAFDFSKIKY
ncbi:MAG: RagB/SusD family nutrient uptake outer membrane protein [Bacteroidota bacterium]|nr:RagB/SusD family nutrient uptake outer membrane protein [Bacteroidota bacterium]MDP4214710.1 RagB/SusD family nutrient uptake outer membrane protein [Bacteroidota bacterium]MDP4246960.1 RagB/SusD family nutrient uptake outer membrane protein [Bacteroidota bacterium]MDP4253781.1 RagB/SusD family nutrient uptake outer membrane protein [Bacteroidota bacterium]MDP4257701.1 RagB/SusD family nutrient uptake outer membrane protein [Bacteroidota bacterium]